MGFSNNRAERTDSRSRHREIVIDVRLPVGSGIGGPHVNVMVADDAAVGHRLRKRLGRVTDPPMATRPQHCTSRGAGQDLAVALALALPSESCVRPVVLLDQIPLAMEFLDLAVDPCDLIYITEIVTTTTPYSPSSSAFVSALHMLGENIFFLEGTRSSGLISHGLLALVPYCHYQVRDSRHKLAIPEHHVAGLECTNSQPTLLSKRRHF